MKRSFAALTLIGVIVTAGCGFAVLSGLESVKTGPDRMVAVRYQADASLTLLNEAKSLTGFRFADRRGGEGDNDPYRVGGVYGLYGRRISKVMADAPFQQSLAQALAAGFSARGVDATAVEDREFAPDMPFRTLFAMAGEVHNFSTEWRSGGITAHISGLVRRYDTDRALLVEKRISERASSLGWLTLESGRYADEKASERLEAALNKALAGFVKKVVTDPDITGRLTAHQ